MSTFPFSIVNSRRRQIKQPPIPNDFTTFVSIFPKPVKFASSVTCEPNEFYLGAGSKEKPAILTIGSSSWWKDPGFDQPLLEIQVPSIKMAESAINDNIASMLSVVLGEAQPGIFYVPNKIKREEITEADIEKYAELQKKWYYKLVQMADIDWARHNGNPLAISDTARLAAQELGLKDKAWLGDFNTIQMIECVACGALRNPRFPVCPGCKNIVDVELADKLGIKKAS